MKAVVSVTFDDCLAVHDIKVIYARDRYFIVMPSRKNPDGTYRDIVHPISADFRKSLEKAVIDAYNVQLIAAEHDLENENEHRGQLRRRERGDGKLF
jgi:stage V sporulation protein G